LTGQHVSYYRIYILLKQDRKMMFIVVWGMITQSSSKGQY